MKTKQCDNLRTATLAVPLTDGICNFEELPRFIVNSGESLPISFYTMEKARKYAITLMHHYSYVSIYDLVSGKLTEIYCWLPFSPWGFVPHGLIISIMKVESIQLYDCFNVHRPCTIPDKEFNSLFDIAQFYHEFLLKDNTLSQCLIWVDNQRYIFVSKDTFDVHFHGFFNSPTKHKNYTPFQTELCRTSLNNF